MSPNVTHSEPNKPYVTFYSFLSRNICYLSIKSVPIQTLQVLVPWASKVQTTSGRKTKYLPRKTVCSRDFEENIPVMRVRTSEVDGFRGGGLWS